MNVLALDIATTTGFAQVWKGVYESGKVTCAVVDEEFPGFRFRQFEAWLLDKLTDGAGNACFDRVYFERPLVGPDMNAHTALTLYGFAAITQKVCDLLLIPHRWGTEENLGMTVAPNTLKKWATGSGRSGKFAMIERAINLDEDFRERYDKWTRARKRAHSTVEKEWSDEADAICLLHYALEVLIPAELVEKGAE